MAGPKRALSSVKTLLNRLARCERTYRTAPPQWSDPPYPERNATALVEALRALGALGAGAEPALPVLAEYLTHPGEYLVPERVEYWDWTMSDACAEVIPEHAVRVAEVAVQALCCVGPAAVPWLEGACRSTDPRVRLFAVYGFRGPLRSCAARGEQLARAELRRGDCANPGEVAKCACECRLIADPTPAAAVALIGDPDPLVAVAAMDLTYNRWPGALTDEQQREHAEQFREALAARFRAPDPALVAKAISALMNPAIASRGVEHRVRALKGHPDPRVRQQVGNVLATLNHLNPGPA